MWVSVRDAAALLTVSEDTIRRRMKAGALVSRQEPTPSGFRWLVELPEPPLQDAPAEGPQIPGADSDGAPASASAKGHVGEEAALRELIATLQRELETRNDELAARRREVQELHILLGRARGRELPPQTVDAAPATTPASGGVAPPHVPPRRRPRPLWVRLLDALRGP